MQHSEAVGTHDSSAKPGSRLKDSGINQLRERGVGCRGEQEEQ